ncbi:helix-turn-helix protein [Lentzea atacamensis]|uniref:Helix-turn-helix protein n=1 Tax=Lentzea atacamensis TaxID=531938 RepID=A0ABX9DYP2_9PSEU|nr:helix-turn-helix transcriptional regulator [Lentzea atacamensis]RAS59009.1 helix-turn-helix protein [Lentzea atacamensis]
MPKRFSTVRGRELGNGLRTAIAAAGFTSRALAERADWDEAKLSCLVNGKGGVSDVELGVLLGLCGVNPVERDHLLSLLPVAQVKSWLQEHGTCPPVYHRTLAENLAAAKTLISWRGIALPELLQTPAYMRAAIMASPTVPGAEVEARVKARLKMQEQLRRRGLTCTFYIHELALSLPVGGGEARQEQLHHLLRVAVRPNVDIRIVPTAIGAHVGMDRPFTQLTFEKYEPVVCVECETSTAFIEDEASIEAYVEVVRALSESSLDADESKALIASLGETQSPLGEAV